MAFKKLREFLDEAFRFTSNKPEEYAPEYNNLITDEPEEGNLLDPTPLDEKPTLLSEKSIAFDDNGFDKNSTLDIVQTAEGDVFAIKTVTDQNTNETTYSYYEVDSNGQLRHADEKPIGLENADIATGTRFEMTNGDDIEMVVGGEIKDWVEEQNATRETEFQFNDNAMHFAKLMDNMATPKADVAPKSGI